MALSIRKDAEAVLGLDERECGEQLAISNANVLSRGQGTRVKKHFVPKVWTAALLPHEGPPEGPAVAGRLRTSSDIHAATPRTWGHMSHAEGEFKVRMELRLLI